MMMTGPTAHGELVINVEPAGNAKHPVALPPAPSVTSSIESSISDDNKSKFRTRVWVIATTLIILLLAASLGLLINLTLNKDSNSSMAPKSGAKDDGSDHHNVPDSGSHTHTNYDFKASHLTATFNPYPATDFMGEMTLNEDSQVWLTAKQGGGFTLHYVLKGLEPEEAMGGFSVYTGTTCTTIEQQLGVRGFVHSPMLNALWGKEVGATSAQGSVDINSVSFGIEQVEQHTLIVQDQSGARIGCGVLLYQDHHFDEDHLTTTFMDYPDSDAKGAATLAADSQVWITAKPAGGYKIHYFLTGLPKSELEGGLHVHTGKSCDAHEKVLGHYFATKEDPWTTTWSKIAGSTVAFGSVDVADPGFPLMMNDNHAFVVHEQSGKRIGCGLLHSVGVSVDRLKEANAELQAQNEALRKVLIAANN